jgi:hypothetical protein
MVRRAGSLVLIRAGLLEHFPAKHALGLDPGVETGSPQKMRPLKKNKSEFRFHRNGIRSNARDFQ